MDAARAEHQLRTIADVLRVSAALGIQLWLRGGWAMDFFLGHVTRDHVDIDWFGWLDDAPALEVALHADGYRTIPGPPPDQQLDVTKDNEELGFAWLARGTHGQVTVAGGQFAGEPWPDGMLDWPASGRIGDLQAPIISPYVQIEIKEMMPVWVPGRPRRLKDAEDVARLRQALESEKAQPSQVCP
jgi:Aminoglycoside-2''-adenylyltransferase